MQAAEDDAGTEMGAPGAQDDAGEAFEQHLDSDSSHKPGQRSAEAMVDAAPYRKAGGFALGDIEAVGASNAPGSRLAESTSRTR